MWVPGCSSAWPAPRVRRRGGRSCDGTPTSGAGTALAFLLLGQIITAVAWTPQLSLASVYVQENVDKFKVGYYIAWIQGGTLLSL